MAWETEVTSTPTRPVYNVVIATKGLQDRNINIIAGTTVENKGQLILIVMEHFNSTLFHKSGPANKQHINQPTNQPIWIRPGTGSTQPREDIWIIN